MFIKRKPKKKESQKTPDKRGIIIFKKKYNNSHIKMREELKQINQCKEKKKCPKKKINPRVHKIRREKVKNKALNTIVITIIAITLISLSYIVLKFVTDIRGGTTIEDIASESAFVEGLGNIPTYPKSEFVYKNNMGEETVQNMLSKGISVYRAPSKTRSESVYQFYEEELLKKGWENVLTILISTDEFLHGQYWIKEDKGLRIYIQNNDIWYETLSREEASTGLRKRREQELQRQRILESSSEQLLLPNYPWFLEIPSNYIILYSQNKNQQLESVNIQKIGENEKYLIYPLGKSNEKTFDEYLEEFIKQIDETEKEEWEIKSRKNSTLNDRLIYSFEITIDGQIGNGILLENKRNFYTYAIVSNTQDSVFFEYILNNIRES